MQPVLAAFGTGDAADELAVLVAELRGVRFIETAIRVEGLGSLPGVDDLVERHGDALQCAPVAFLCLAQAYAFQSDFMTVHWFTSSGCGALTSGGNASRARTSLTSIHPDSRAVL